MTTKFLSDAQLEGMAGRLLDRYEVMYGDVLGPQVPVERILEDVLDLSILWDEVAESPHQSILAALDSGSKTVIFNESRRALIMDTPGLYYTVLAHEAGHWELHVDHALMNQEPLPGLDGEFSCLYRSSGPRQDPKEVQAHRFMGYLLMPTQLLLSEVRDVDLLNWPVLYKLRDRFHVSLTALKVRLEGLGLLYVAEGGKLYSSRQEYEGQLRLMV